MVLDIVTTFARLALIKAATAGRFLSRDELAQTLAPLRASDREAPPDLGAVLDALVQHCQQRGEPDLTALLLDRNNPPMTASTQTTVDEHTRAQHAQVRRVFAHWDPGTA